MKVSSMLMSKLVVCEVSPRARAMRDDARVRKSLLRVGECMLIRGNAYSRWWRLGRSVLLQADPRGC